MLFSLGIGANQTKPWPEKIILTKIRPKACECDAPRDTHSTETPPSHTHTTRREMIEYAMNQHAQLEENASIAPKLVCLHQGQRADGPSREQAHRALQRAREPASITAHPTPIPAPRRPRRRCKRTN